MASGQDVRIKLSAEGLAEVVSAFQKISSEGKKSAQETSSAFAALGKQFQDVQKHMLGLLSIGLAADKFAEFFKSSLVGVEALTRLSKQTGLSTDALQGFQRAARETGVGQDAANAALTKFTVSMGKAEIGSKQTQQAMSDLGLRVKDLAALPADQRLEAVASALAKISDPARRARDEVALFGRSGIELDQALVKVGAQGMGTFITHLQELGLYLDKDTIDSMQRAQEGLRNLGDQVKGLATQFLAGLLPSLQAASDELVKATTGPGVSGFKTLGELVGSFAHGVVTAFTVAGKEIGAFFAEVAVLAKGVVRIVNATSFSGIVNEAKSTTAQIRAIEEGLQHDFDAIKAGSTEKKPAAQASTTPQVGEAQGNLEAISRARLAFIEQQLQNELKLYQAHAQLLQEQDKAAYDAGLISTQEYFAKRAAIINQEIDKELAIAKQRRAAVASQATDPNDAAAQIKQKTELLKVDGEIADLEAKRGVELAGNAGQQQQAELKQAKDMLAAQEKLLEIEGKKTAAAKLKLEADLKDLQVELQKSGAPQAQVASALDTARTQGGAQIGFDQQIGQADAAMKQLEATVTGINDRVKDGQLFAVQGANQVRQAEAAALPVLQQQAAELLKIAQLTGNPQALQQATAYQLKVQQIAVATDQWGQDLAKLKQVGEDSLVNGLSNAINQILTHTKSVGQAFRQMGLQIAESIEQAIVKMMILKALESVGGFAGGGQASSGFATGGLVHGPGTSTSDSIPAMLSDKEFVVNAKAAQQPGMLPLLDAINRGGLRSSTPSMGVPKFAAGGSVSASKAPSIRITNVLDPTVMGDHLASAEGETAVLNVLARNPNKVKGIVG